MPTQIELLQEANRRGILPPEKKALFDAAVSRGLIKPQEQFSVMPETANRLTELEAKQAQKDQLMRNTGGSEDILQKTGAFTPSSDLTETRRHAELQTQGVTTDQDLVAGNLELGYAKDPIEGLSRVLTKELGAPVQVYKDKEDLIYVDPKTNKKILVNPDWRAKLGQGLPIAGDITGTVIGGAGGLALTKHPAGMVAGETLGSTAGTAIGEAIRLQTGNVLGVNDMEAGDIAIDSTIEGAKAGGVTLATGGLISAFKGIRNQINGGMFDKDEAVKYTGIIKEAEEKIAEVNRIAGDKKAVIGTMGRKSDDVTAQAGEAQVRKNQAHAQDFVDRDVSDQVGLNKALNNLTKADDTVKGGQAIQDVALEQSNKRLAQGKVIHAENERQLTAQLDDIGKQAKETVGKPTRDLIIEKRELLKGAENNAWDRVKRVGGYNEKSKTYGIDIETGVNTKKFKNILDRRSNTSTTKVVGTGTGGIYNKGSTKADLADFNAEISSLRKQSRAMKKSLQYGNPDTKNIDEVISSMVKDRRYRLILAGKSDLLKKIETAERRTAKFHEIYDRSVVGDLTSKTKNGVFKIKDKDFVDKMLKGDTEEIVQLKTVIGDNASLMVQWKEGISDIYKKAAYTDNKFNATRSADFIKANRANLEQFFKPTELDKWSKVGGLAQKVEKQAKQLDDIIKAANNKWGRGKLKSMDGENLMKFVTNDTGSFSKPLGSGVQSMTKKIDYVKNITKNYPQAWDKFKTEYSTKLKDTAFNSAKERIDTNKLGKMIKDEGKAIEKVMGKQYLADLKSIHEVSKILNKPLTSLSRDENVGIVIQSLRSAVAPPLTRRGRAFTAAVMFDNKRAHDAMARAFLNPNEMHEIAKLSEHSTITRQTAELAASLGLIIDEDE